ncbi:phosphotransferase [Dactylosporangium vinaceum]|uniref:AAA family ATPase n=1 Tax=Dactylosporangium vinaceum TaxID=53362 RepID=A0ABV5M9L5_9ACTN|nr:AAA family ATPase [Dactylosporangium vinaceum]UAC00046.1 phosphotransferase [Dactylosporangium vinaceum]
MDSAPLDGCVLVTGMPGAGKSTVTALAAGLLPRAARVTGDEMNMMLVSGRVGFQCQPADESARQAELCKRNICALANNFVDYGFTVLVDTVVANRAELDFMLGLLAPRPVRLVILAPGIDACTYRNLHRDPEDQFFFNGYPQLETAMRRDLADLGWWFDTSALTAQETAERLVAEATRRCSLW